MPAHVGPHQVKQPAGTGNAALAADAAERFPCREGHAKALDGGLPVKARCWHKKDRIANSLCCHRTMRYCWHMTATYRTAVTRAARTTSNVLHIAEVVRGARWMETRFGDALCGVLVAHFPESGERGKPESATCPRCRRAYRKIAEG